MNVIVEKSRRLSVAQESCEIVERKGLGHPDTICDSIVEEICRKIAREYQQRFGIILHHNFDKALLRGGSVERQFGGGKVLKPMLLILGDRATFSFDGQNIPVNQLALATAKEWLKRNLRFVDPESHMKFQSEIRPGSSELQAIFSERKKVLGANDTSVGFGFAPLTQTEALVLQTERHLNSLNFKESFPESGEDIKIMAIRRAQELDLTIAMSFVDRYIESERAYFEKKKILQNRIRQFVQMKGRGFRKINIFLNTLDKKRHGVAGLYLTVTGTSAEEADSGQIGRGNRVNGIISFNRPCSLEAAAGKNAVSHVGKIYNVLANKIAHRIYSDVDGVEEVYLWLVSRIGTAVNQPEVVRTNLVLQPRASFSSVSRKIRSILEEELAGIEIFCEDLLRGKYSVV